MSEAVLRTLSTLEEATGDFWVDFQIPVLETANSLVFFKYAYSRYHPCIIQKGLIEDWAALKKWNEEYLCEKLGEKKVSVNLTREGRADSILWVDSRNEECFVYPAEAKMTISEFFDCMNERKPDLVPYLSQQNDNLRSEFPELVEDIKLDIQLATDVFESGAPEAANLWIGDDRSVSSIHKDHYENFYAVISGAKTFTLLPPTDCVYLPEKVYPTAKYEISGGSDTLGSLQLSSENCPTTSLSWISLDPDDPHVCEKYPSFARTHPLRCTVYPGEVLYIPAMWYHRVSQTVPTISVNFWYDQRFDFRYVFYSTIQQLKDKAIEEDP